MSSQGRPPDLSSLADVLAQDTQADGASTREQLVAPVPVARVLDVRGERAITQAEYAEIADDKSLHLFVDTTRTLGRSHPARRRGLDGGVQSVLLPVWQAAALIELIQASRPVRPRELASLREARSHDPLRVVERMRQRIDVTLRGTPCRWRAIETVVGKSAEARAFAWRPPRSLRWAVVLRL